MGLSSLTLPSIEKRFSLSSTELGVIMASNDVAALVVVVFISYYGDYGNKIRWFGGGGIVLGESPFYVHAFKPSTEQKLIALFSAFSVLLYALPHFLIGRYEPTHTGLRGPSCFSGNATAGQAQCSEESDSSWYYMAIFVLAQVFMGVGVSPFYSLLPAYLDENVHPKHMPLYMAVWSCATFAGPGLGMIIGGKLLSIYVDLEQVN